MILLPQHAKAYTTIPSFLLTFLDGLKLLQKQAKLGFSSSGFQGHKLKDGEVREQLSAVRQKDIVGMIKRHAGLRQVPHMCFPDEENGPSAFSGAFVSCELAEGDTDKTAKAAENRTLIPAHGKHAEMLSTAREI